MSNKQKTLKASVSFSGKGLHTGANVNMKVCPAPDNHGLVFKRTDLDGQPEIPALCDFVSDTSRSTTLENKTVKVHTVEHILSALWTMGVDNALIEVDGPEIPIMDGSARDFAEAICKTGLEEQCAPIKYYQVTEKSYFEVPENGVRMEIYPDDHFAVSVHIDYGSKVLGNQYAVFDAATDDYKETVAPCRTFVFLHELEPLFQHNLIKGGDMDNAIVVVEKPVEQAELDRLCKIFNKPDIKVESGYLNNIDLRFVNEPARHKLLDVLGDFALMGVRIKGRVMATRPGHFANTETIRQLRRQMRKEGVKPTYFHNPNEEPVYDIKGIMGKLPHRPPFLLVDKIIHIDSNNIAGIKNVTMNEPFFVGHFPQEPVMPGVLIVEAMAQCGGILAMHDMDPQYDYSTYFMKIDEVRFKNKVIPGDTLHFELQLAEPIRRGIVIMNARAFVGDKLACEAKLMAQVAPVGKKQ